MLRGPQTVAELKTRTERLHRFASADEVASALARLDGRSSFGSCPASRASARSGGRTCSADERAAERAGIAGRDRRTLEQRLAQVEERLAELERRLDER